MTAMRHLKLYSVLVLPLLGAFGALLQSMWVLYAVIGLTCGLVIWCTIKKMTSGFYMLSLYSICLALLLSTTLISSQLTGADIHLEYYYAKQAMDSWDYTLPHAINGALSVTIFTPLLSKLLGIDPLWVFKIVFPMLFASVPVILYAVFRRLLDERQSFLAAFFLISVPVMTLEITAMARQQIAEVFFALGLLALVHEKLGWKAKMACLTGCGILVALSHYSLTPILLIYLGSCFVLFLFRGKWCQLLVVTVPSVVIVAFALVYFGWVASGIGLHHFMSLAGVELAPIEIEVTDLPQTRPAGEPIDVTAEVTDWAKRGKLFAVGWGLDFVTVDGSAKAFRVLQFATQGLVMVGVCFLWLSKRISLTIKGLALGGTLLLALCFVVPGFMGTLNLSRFYHLALFGLASAFVIGGLKLLRREWAVLLVLLPYFVFASGAIFEIQQRTDLGHWSVPYSIAFSNKRLDAGGYLTDNDAAVAAYAHRQSLSPVYADQHGVLLLQESYGMDARVVIVPYPGGASPLPGYLFLREWNNDNRQMTYWVGPGLREFVGYSDLDCLKINERKTVFSSGGALLLGKEE